MSVKVAVRVRPFNSREKKLECKCCVDMKDPMTILLPFQNEAERSFTFDYSFWSFDEFTEQPDGYLKANGSKYADQQQVFQRIGQDILNNAWQGYHCCLFAYGQTGSGKSYSMIGYGVNKGIVPITCNEIFERIKAKKDATEYEVRASMLEIYNQEVQDLTIPIGQRVAGGLKIRENKLLGIYVDGVKKHLVTSFAQIENVMDSGTKNRTVAATQMNATSSRAHTIITVEFKQVTKTGTAKSQKISMINLVDLAGSERQQKTGATGQRLKEAVGINQSLTSLGQVISILAKNSDGGNQFVPYRNSALTRILQNALGGNSKTIMICAISPANDNYEQSLSTLRYADSAKKIKNKPVVNESAEDKMIRELKSQNERLQKLLGGKGGATGNEPAVDTEALKKKEEEIKKKEEEFAKKQKEQEERLQKLEAMLADKEKQKEALMKKKQQELEALEKKLAEEQDEAEKLKVELQLQKKKAEEEEKQKKLKESEQKIKKDQQKQKQILNDQKMQLENSQNELKNMKQNVLDDDDLDDAAIEANLAQLNQKLEDLKKTVEEKKKQSIEDQKNLEASNKDAGLLNEKDLKELQKKGALPPYLENISKDVMINRKLKIPLEKSVITIGKVGMSPPNDIVFGGRDVSPRHATIHIIDGKVFLKPVQSDSHLYVNGKQIKDTYELLNLDRVIFGWNSVYLFKNKHDNRSDQKIKDKEINWDFVRDEVEDLVDIDETDTEDGGCCRIF